MAFKLLSNLWKNLLFSPIKDEEIYLAKEKLKSSFLIFNQSLEEILQRKIQLISYGVSYKNEENPIKQIDETSPGKIQKLIQKYFTKPYLSVSGEKKICDEIKSQWLRTFLN